MVRSSISKRRLLQRLLSKRWSDSCWLSVPYAIPQENMPSMPMGVYHWHLQSWDHLVGHCSRGRVIVAALRLRFCEASRTTVGVHHHVTWVEQACHMRGSTHISVDLSTVARYWRW